MNVANRELSEELFKISGWGQTSFHFVAHRKYESDEYMDAELQYLTNIPNELRWTGAKIRPAYDLGYLLRKLPATIKDTDGLTCSWGLWKGIDGYTTAYGSPDGEDFEVMKVADTPENATAKLCIELLKQGILKKNAGGSQ